MAKLKVKMQSEIIDGSKESFVIIQGENENEKPLFISLDHAKELVSDLKTMLKSEY